MEGDLETRLERLTQEHREERKKVMLLKKAIKTEREEKDRLLKSLSEFKDKLGVLECSMAEKDSKIKLLQYEKEDLEAEIIDEREKIKSLGMGGSNSPTPSSRSLSALEQQNKKLIEEYYHLKEINAKAEERIKAITL
jgi:chromosome segregation ATPase